MAFFYDFEKHGNNSRRYRAIWPMFRRRSYRAVAAMWEAAIKRLGVWGADLALNQKMYLFFMQLKEYVFAAVT